MREIARASAVHSANSTSMHFLQPPHRLIPLAAAFCVATAARADVKLPAIISDHMVLQAETPATVWGWADAGEKVAVKFADKSAETVAGPEGRWSVKLPELKAGTAGELSVAGKNALTIKDVIVGEVWVCSGQSNMEWSVAGSANPKEESAAANFPQIRMFTVQKSPQLEPKDDCKGTWKVCLPENAPGFSAVGYFFGRKLHQALNQPVGLIHTSWGGTPAEFWTPQPVLASDPAFQPIIENWEAKKAAYPQAKAKWEEAMAKWREEEKAANEAGAKPGNPPREPQGGGAFGAPACLYNGMIAPITPYTIRGAIWYQGESNAGAARLYRKLFPTMILSWRRAWADDFPFLFVQLANFDARKLPPTGQPQDSNWAELREAQAMTLELPRTGMAVAIDIGEANDIHPKNKQEVGRRLALAAEATVYYRDQEFSGPLFSGAQAEDGKMRLNFRHAQGMKAKDGGKLKGFAIAGADQKFVWANAEIDGDHIIVSSPDVTAPVAVRYAWADDPECNLINATGLPASPFRTDDWPQR
jgi:sialate O-acetylesterase